MVTNLILKCYFINSYEILKWHILSMWSSLIFFRQILIFCVNFVNEIWMVNSLLYVVFTYTFILLYKEILFRIFDDIFNYIIFTFI